MTTKNSTTKRYRIPADRIQNLEIDRGGRITPRLHDLEPLENTLLSALYPQIRVASVNVPSEQLDDYEESQVENALAQLTWNGIHYKLVGASGSAKKGKFYFVDRDHSRLIAERFQHWPQAAIVYFGILVSPCKVMLEEPEAEVLVVPDHKLGTNDCRGWLRRSLFEKLKQKHDAEVVADHVERLRRERTGRALDNGCSNADGLQLEEIAKREIAHKFLPSGRFYQFRMAFANTQAKGSFKWMDDDVADALKADFVLPESAIKPGLKGPAVVFSVIGEGRRFRGPIAMGIRETKFALCIVLTASAASAQPNPETQTLTICDVRSHAKKYLGKVITVNGEVQGTGYDGVVGMSNSQCPTVGVALAESEEMKKSRDPQSELFRDGMRKTMLCTDERVFVATVQGRYGTAVTRGIVVSPKI